MSSFGRSNLKSSRGDGIGGKGLVLVPSSGTYSKVVLWFHGLGDEADGWASMMPELELHDTKFILPTADVLPISLNGGYPMTAWSDLHGLDMDAQEDSAGFDKSASRVDALVKKEIESGIESRKIAVGGFSHGGALALHYSLRSPLQLAGCVALSTWLPMRKDYPAALSQQAKSLSVLQAHGKQDQVVAHTWGAETNQLLKTLITEAESAPEFMSIEGMAHSSHPLEMNRVASFLKTRLS